MITQRYNINLIPDKVPVQVNCSQYDSLSRTIEFTIYDGTVLFEIPSGSTVTVRGTKSDNTGFEYPCTFDGSIVSFDIQAQMTIFSGRVPCEIRFVNNGIIGTCNFNLYVEPTPLDTDVTISETDLPLLEEAEQNAIRAEQAADRAEEFLDTKQDKLTAGEGISILNNTISNVFVQLANPNLNDISYNYQGYGYGCTNVPTGANSGGQICVIARRSGSYCTQLYFPYDSTDIYLRKLINGVWGDWIELQSLLTAGNGISISNGVITNAFTYLNAQDLNDLSTYFVGYAYNCTNRPSGTTAFGTLISIVGAGRRSQLYTNLYDGKIYSRKYYGSAWSEWAEVVTSYVAGDVITRSNSTASDIECGGFTSTSSTGIYFFLPLDKPINATNAIISSLYMITRGISGYLYGSSFIDVCADSNYTVSAKIVENGLSVSVVRNTAFNVTNNTPVSVLVRGRTITLS